MSSDPGKHRHVSANTMTPSRANEDAIAQQQHSNRNDPVITIKPKFGWWMNLLFKWNKRKIFTAGRSKTGWFTITGHFNSTSGFTMASPEKILFSPNTIYGVEGMIFSVRKGSLIAETLGDITIIWKVMAFYDVMPSAEIFCKRVGKINRG